MARWRSALDHPILWLELRRIRRRRWWPGRRFFLFYPVLLGTSLGYGVALALNDSLATRTLALATGLPLVCAVSAVAWLLSLLLPWIAPVLTGMAIAREREMGTFDLLRATLLTERSIVLGKLAGAMAQLGPAILVMALLTPFQLALTSTGVWAGQIMGGSELGVKWVGALLLMVVAGWFKPWASLVFGAALGIFVSALSRTSSAAIAATLGTLIVVRVALGFAGSVLISVLPFSFRSPEMVLLSPGLVSLATVLIEGVGAVLAVWAAIWWLKYR